jgi:hypothetical protein
MMAGLGLLTIRAKMLLVPLNSIETCGKLPPHAMVGPVVKYFDVNIVFQHFNKLKRKHIPASPLTKVSTALEAVETVSPVENDLIASVATDRMSFPKAGAVQTAHNMASTNAKGAMIDDGGLQVVIKCTVQ